MIYECAKRVRNAPTRVIAMMQEIAPRAVTSAEYVRMIGRLRDPCHGVYRPGRERTGLLCAGFFVPGSDTHGNVDEALTVRSATARQSQLRMI